MSSTFPTRSVRLSALATLLAAALLVPGTAVSDDSVLFSTRVAPNVMLLVDNSGSMNHIVWHPKYKPADTPTCRNYSDDSQYFFSSDQLGFEKCSKTINLYVDPDVSGSTRFMGRYLNWLFSPESDAYNAEIEAAANGTYSACLGGGSYSLYRRARVTAAKDIMREVICQVNQSSEVRFGIAQFRRPIYPDPDTTSSDPNGGYVRVPANDYLVGGSPNVYTLNGTSQSHGNHLDDAIDTFVGESWTPLAESLLQIYTYFMSRTAAERPVGVDTTTRFPEYEYDTDSGPGQGGPHSGSGPPTVPDSPVQWACQKNFVIVLTDGEPTRDDFDVIAPTNTAAGFSSFSDLIGDYNDDSEDETPGSFPGCTNCEATRYLDDIAKFMHDTDMRLDLDDDQTVDVYTLGFSTSPFANAILKKTAEVGGGTFYESTNAEELSSALVAAVNDIIAKTQSFAAATVPTTRTSAGDKFFNGYFVPSVNDGYWEGHLRSWGFTAAGEIHDKYGACALDDPTPSQCLAGEFKPSAEPFWDAGEEIPAPASRKLYTSKLTGPGTSARTVFKHTTESGSLTAADLTVAYPPPATIPGSAATSDEELAAEVVGNVRGCTFGTGANGVGCTERDWLLGDIFHSSPILVPRPTANRPEQSYKDFKDDSLNTAVARRDRVLVAGANDGFLHIFHGGDYNALTKTYDAGTGAELAGFMPYTARKNAKELATDGGSRDFYTVDGTPSIADVWLYTDPTKTDEADKLMSEWTTVAVAGLRQGGHQLYALDITNPAAAGYPGYLWEFPREDAAAALTDIMGETWSRPIITRVKVKIDTDDNGGQGYERYVAIFGAGYDAKSDPNDTATYDVTQKGGRALIMLDLKTGEILGKKEFDTTGGAGAPTVDPSLWTYDPAKPESSMHYAFASTPAVYDLDFDGFADVVYIGDLGGGMWKWVIQDIGDDPVNGLGSDTSQPNWPFKKFFAAPVYDSGSAKYYKSFYNPPSATIKSGKLWLAFGSGERMNLGFMGFSGTDLENNRFYSMIDIDPHEDAPPAPNNPATEADLQDVTGMDDSCVGITGRGFYFLGVDGEKFVTTSDIAFYYVFMASYVPTVSADPCESGGEAYLYAFKVYCGEGLFDDGGGNSESKLSLGDGMPTDPQISIGADDSQVVIIIGNRIERPPPGPGHSKKSGIASWRERSPQ